ncbi:hypothetical protein DKX38_024589 [Salix brachista]|uniref:Uncharacterized protein n=1 Tax=Salix brachista TaxID=2182728 RepID=A0A5N5JS43_9ROSI|nr:hypothetical protein DKX38_024589 [Salix brachista]
MNTPIKGGSLFIADEMFLLLFLCEGRFGTMKSKIKTMKCVGRQRLIEETKLQHVDGDIPDNSQLPTDKRHRGVPISEINVVLSNVSAMSGTSTLEVQTNTSADNAKTDAICGNANVLAQQIENSSDVQNVSLNEDNNGY